MLNPSVRLEKQKEAPLAVLIDLIVVFVSHAVCYVQRLLGITGSSSNQLFGLTPFFVRRVNRRYHNNYPRSSIGQIKKADVVGFNKSDQGRGCYEVVAN